MLAQHTRQNIKRYATEVVKNLNRLFLLQGRLTEIFTL